MEFAKSFQPYALVKANQGIQQGDIICNCPVLIPQNATTIQEENQSGEVVEYNVIVMSQSCDLANRKIENVLVCPFYTLEELGAQDSQFKKSKVKNMLRKGFITSYHLLHSCSEGGFTNEYLVVDFRNVYGVQYDFLESFAKSIGDRIRLLPPFREHLSQAFARFFMRVGLPVDIPEF